MKTKDIKRKIAEYFFINPTVKLRVRQIEREVQVPLPSAIRYTKELEKEKILKSTSIAGMKIYSADRVSSHFLLKKKLYNLQTLFSSGFVDFLVKEMSNPALVVFGSYSKGEDVETSDIDIYIESPKKTIKSVKQFEEKLQRRIQLFKYKKIALVKNKDLVNNIINGIVLNGFLEVFK